MAKPKAKRSGRTASRGRSAKKSKPARRLSRAPRASQARTAAKRPAAKKRSVKRAAPARRPAPSTPAKARASARNTTKSIKTLTPPSPPGTGTRKKTPRLDRVRRTLDETVQTPPSSLDMDRRGSAARTGRAEMAEKRRDHHGMNALSAGDPDVDVQDAYFTGEEAPGGDNPTPDQDIVDDIGKALGVEYEDNEELKASDKVVERDKHRWELDPASSEDYKDRK